jgi:hypothetical protein
MGCWTSSGYMQLTCGGRWGRNLFLAVAANDRSAKKASRRKPLSLCLALAYEVEGRFMATSIEERRREEKRREEKKSEVRFGIPR